MAKRIVGSILHGAYGDVYEQALCLKHYAAMHPGTELRLFAATKTRLEAFRALDLTFASCFELWTEIDRSEDIDEFFQFQIRDPELNSKLLAHLSPASLAKFDRKTTVLPWVYMRDYGLISEPQAFRLSLSASGQSQLLVVAEQNGIPETIWHRPTISFLWRYRKGREGLSSFGQKSEQECVRRYSQMFRKLISRFGCHILVCGMNVVTDGSNRERTDNKYSTFGLDLPSECVTYMKGLSWPLELELASRATVACGNASGFTEGLWLKRGGKMVLMDPAPHYLVKAAYHRMPLFHLNRPEELLRAITMHSTNSYEKRIAHILTRST